MTGKMPVIFYVKKHGSSFVKKEIILIIDDAAGGYL